MAKRFVLTAALQLQAPSGSNISSVVNSINKSLRGISVTVAVNIPSSTAGQLTKITKGLNSVSKGAGDATSELERFGKQSALAIRRFAAFSAATAAFIGLGSAMKRSFTQAIDFDREMVRISQVTGTSLKDLKDLTGEITRLSTTFGVSSTKIASVATILSQAGLSANETKTALESLSKTELSATFEDIKDTTEGAIAVMAQFGTGAKDLESQLSSINSVAGKFAVESSDLITAVRRTGGAFKASGGSLNELIALFTSVRATTRESAESIATGFRTIFTRIQRPKTIEFLKELGIELRDIKGQFIGPYEAVRKLSEALKAIPSTDPRFAQIIEELGGFRQVSKVIPLIQQFEVSEKALNIAMRNSTSITEDAEKAQQALSVQIAKLREQFDALFRKIADNAGIRGFIDFTLQLSSALIRVADAIEPLLPLIISLGSIKVAGSLAQIGKGFASNIGGTKKFASGGLVPGTGTGDTVPAMLSPGEFVLRKSAVSALGMKNAQHMAAGGIPNAVGKKNIAIDSTFGGLFLNGGTHGGEPTAIETTPRQIIKESSTGATKSILDSFAQSHGRKLDDYQTVTASPRLFSLGDKAKGAFSHFLEDGVPKLFNDAAKAIVPSEFNIHPESISMKDIFGSSTEGVKGSFFQGFIHRATNTIGEEKGDIFDFTHADARFNNLFPGDFSSALPVDAKANDRRPQILNLLGKAIRYPGTSKLREFARGGSVGSDTIPAMLTPGEFVVNKQAVGQIGVGNLHKVNKFAKGGLVGNIANNPGGALLLGSVLATTLGNLGGFGKELTSVTSTLASFGAQAVVLTGLIKSGPISSKANAGLEKAQGLRAGIEQQVSNRRDILEANIENIKQFALKNPHKTVPPKLINARDESFKALASSQNAFARVDKVTKSQEALVKSTNKVAIAVGILGAAAEVAGQHLGEIGEAQIKAGDFEGGKSNTRIGGALTGAGLGATAGAFLGPVGAAVGAGVGGVAGFIHGGATADSQIASKKTDIKIEELVKSLREQSGNIKENKVPDVTKINTLLNDLNKGSIGGGSTGAGDLQHFANTVTFGHFQERLGIHDVNSGPTAEQAADNANKFKQASPEIESFLNELVKNSKTFADFDKVGGYAVRTLSRITGIPIEQLNKSFETIIKTNANANKVNEASIRIENARLARLSFIDKVAASFESLAIETDSLTSTLSAVQDAGSGKVGTTRFSDNSSIFNNPRNADLGELTKSTNFAASIVGTPQAGAVAQEAIATAVALKLLPQALQAEANANLGGEGNTLGEGTVNRLGKAKELAGFDPNILRGVFKKLEDAITIEGGPNSDIEARHKTKLNPFSTAESIANKSGVEDAFKAFEVISKTFTEEANKVAQQYTIRRNLQERITDQLSATLEAVAAKDQLVLSFQEKRLDIAKLAAVDAVHKGIVGGAGGVDAVGGRIAQVQRDIETNRTGAEGARGKDVQAFNAFNAALEKSQDEFDRLSKAVDFFANATQRSAAIQNELSKLEGERKNKLGILQEAAFGTPQQQFKLAKTTSLIAATRGPNGQGVFNKLPNQEKRDIIETLERIKGVGGKGAEAAKKQLEDLQKGFNGAFAGVVDASDAEKVAQKLLVDISIEQVKALHIQNGLTAVANTKTGELITTLNNTITNKAQNAGKRFGGLVFAGGGQVPGKGHGDTVPAMLTPGEFVVTKSAVNKVGAGNLQKLNHYAYGGPVNYNGFEYGFGYKKRLGDDSNPYNDPNTGSAARSRLLLKIANDKIRNDRNLTDETRRKLGVSGGPKAPGAYLPDGTKWEPKSNIPNQWGDLIPKGNDRIDPRFRLPGMRMGGPDMNDVLKPGGTKDHPRKSARGADIQKRIQDRQDKINKSIFDKSPRGKIANKDAAVANNDIYKGGADFSQAIEQFSSTSGGLVSALNSFPHTIELTANHKVEVIFNGAEVLAQLGPQFEQFVVGQVDKALANYNNKLQDGRNTA